MVISVRTGDIYAGIEFSQSDKGQETHQDPAGRIRCQENPQFPATSGIGHQARIAQGTERHSAQGHSVRHRQQPASVTIVHKGNIMKFTEGVS